MYYNKDIEDLMQNSKYHTIKDKCNDVAEKLVGKENAYGVSRRIKTLWEKRRDLIKIGKQEQLKEWREEVFELPKKIDPVGIKTSGAEGAGRPKKRLSDSPGLKTENKILDVIILQIEDAATQQTFTKVGTTIQFEMGT